MGFSAQSQDSSRSQEYKWVPVDVLPVRDSITIFATQQGTLETLDKNGVKTGEGITLPDKPIGMGWVGDSFVVFYQKLKRYRTFELHAVTIDLIQRKIGEDKLVQAVPAKYLSVAYLLRTPTGHLTGVLTRMTAYEIDGDPTYPDPGSDLARRQYHTTSEASLFTLNAGLQLQPTPLAGNVLRNRFLGCQMNPQGTLFLETADGSQVISEKISPAGTVAQTLTYPYTLRKNEEIQVQAALDPFSENAVTLATRYAVFRFDFSENKSRISPLDTLTWKWKAQDAMQFLVPIDIEETDDRIILCQETQYLGPSVYYKKWAFHSGGVYWHHGTAVITVFDKQMARRQCYVLGKSFQSAYQFDPAIAIHLVGERLYAATNEHDGEFVYSFDLHERFFERKKLRPAAVWKPGSLKPGFVVWSNNGLLVNYVFDHTILSTNDRTVFIPAAFTDLEVMSPEVWTPMEWQ